MLYSGSAHKLHEVDALVEQIMTKIELLNAQLSEKEEKLSSLFKITSRIVTDYDGETGEMIQTLHFRRDQQVS